MPMSTRPRLALKLSLPRIVRCLRLQHCIVHAVVATLHMEVAAWGPTDTLREPDATHPPSL